MTDERLTKTAGLIPEVYYDLICRIPAGMLFVLGILAESGVFLPAGYLSPSYIKNIGAGATTILMILFLASSYAAGIFLTALGDMIYGLAYRLYIRVLIARNWALVRTFCNELDISDDDSSQNSLLPSEVGWRNVPQETVRFVARNLHDYLKEGSDQARIILPKMKAEASLGFNLGSAALVLLVIIVIWRTVRGAPIVTGDFVALAAAIPLLWLAGYRRAVSFLGRQFAFLRLVLHNRSIRGTRLPASS